MTALRSGRRMHRMADPIPKPIPAGRGFPAPGISACIISFDEERSIAACIDSVSWCDEVVVVDSFSRDRTAEIARERGARVIQAAWPGHVAQKNRALEEAGSEWILSIDCDEEVTPRLREAIQGILRSGPDADGYFISRKLFYLGRWLEHGGWFPEWRLRLCRKAAGRWEGVDPHDTLRVGGRTARIPPGGRGEDAAVILHRSFRGLSHQLSVLDRYTEIQAGELSRAGRRAGWSHLVLRPIWRFLLTYVLRAGFLDGAPGFHMAVNHAYAAYMKYARLWEARKGLATFRAKGDVVPGEKDCGQGGVTRRSKE
jgi:glycosyltransferase involved in cell wall biosynthesis